jgi:peptidoglycan-N-acetylglucosamine deacetylase
MHDGIGPGARRQGCEETVDLLEGLVEHTRFFGCEPYPMSDALARYSTAWRPVNV